MKKIVLLIFSTILFVACNNKSYQINGKTDTKNLDGAQVTLLSFSNESGMSPIDSTIIKNGEFTLKGTVDTLAWYMLTVKSMDGRTIAKDFYIEGELDFTIKNGMARMSGGSINDLYQSFLDKYENLTLNVVKLDAQLKANPTDKALGEAFNVEYERFSAKFRELALSTILQNIDNPLGLHLFLTTMSSLENKDLEAVLSKAKPEFLANPTVKMVISQLDLSKKVSIGSKFSDLSMFKPDATPISLSEYAGKGKYVLVDFWASWCGPCLRELPNVIDCYKKFHDQGFEIVGVSLDEDSNAWKAAIKNYKLPWPQMSDLAGWNSQAVAIYSFSGIPHTVLIDPKGIIIANDLRGEELSKKLVELLGH